MDQAQHVFYIFGSIGMGLLSVFLIVGIIVMLRIASKVSKISRKIHGITTELHQLVQSGRSYTRFLRASMFGSFFGMLLRLLRHNQD